MLPDFNMILQRAFNFSFSEDRSSRFFLLFGLSCTSLFGCRLLSVGQIEPNASGKNLFDPSCMALALSRVVLGVGSTKVLRIACDLVSSLAILCLPLVNFYISLRKSVSKNASKTKLHWINYATGKNNLSKDVIMYLHGGAWVLRDGADVAISSILLPKLAKKTDKIPQICSVQYELATDDTATFQRVHEEIASVYLELVSEGYRVISIMGDSAGGNLAVGVMLTVLDMAEARNLNIPPPLSLVLLSPAVDMRTCAGSFTRNASKDGLNLNFVVSSRFCFFGKYDEQLHIHPLVSFNFNTDDTLKKLPPILMLGGTYELLYDDMATFAKRITDINESPNAMEFVSGQDCSHNYMMCNVPLDFVVPMEETRHAQDRIASFILNLLKTQ